MPDSDEMSVNRRDTPAMTNEREARHWDVMRQEHQDRNLYQRYHRDVWLPDSLRLAAAQFLPDRGKELPISRHYRELQERYKLPLRLHMPHVYDLIELSVVRGTGAIFRALIRAPWNRRSDICIVLEGDFEVVTAFYASQSDMHSTLDMSLYEPLPPSAAEQALLDTLPVGYHKDEEAARRQSRPDDVT